jgi:acyl-CoA thioesterase I
MKYTLLLLSLCCLFLGACKDETATKSQKPNDSTTLTTPKAAVSTKKNIVFFGNSLTAAYGLSMSEGFPALIQKKIDSLHLDYNCVNAGLSGETTVDGKNRVDWILQQPLDVFVLELGGNDALRGLPVDQSKINLQAIVDKVKAKYPDCKIMISGMLAPPNLGAKYTNSFKNMYSDIAKTSNCALLPFLLEGVGGIPKLNLPDGIHPTADGQKIVAENIWKVLFPLLNKN